MSCSGLGRGVAELQLDALYVLEKFGHERVSSLKLMSLSSGTPAATR